MAERAAFVEPQGNAAMRWAMYALGIFALAALAWFVYSSLTSVVGVKVEADTPTAIDMLPPPPPPPPPPPKPQEKPPEPTDTPKPTPEQAAPKTDAPKAMTMDAEATAGPSTIAAGSGGGMGTTSSTGTCVGPNCGKAIGGGVSDGIYRQYLRSALQQAVYRDDRSKRFASSAEFEILVSSGGGIDRVVMRSTSGRPDDDKVLKEILERVRGLRPPPYTQRYPVVIRVSGRKSL